MMVTFTWAALFCIVLAISIDLADGHLIYTLDDPYIHLAVARNILLGGYGVNATEFSSPSSSILWPWLLAVSEWLGLGMAGPLVINVAAAMATVFLSARFLVKNGIVTGAGYLGMAVCGLLLILLTSSVALPLTGMEHSLHVLAVVATIDGLVDAAEERTIPRYLTPALVMMPLLRFEGAALSGLSIIALWYFGKRLIAVRASLAILAAVGAYAAFVLLRDLPFFPSSVLLKSSAASTASGDVQPLRAILLEIKANLRLRAGFCLVLSAMLLSLAAFVFRDSNRRIAVVYAVAVAAIGAHLLVGKIGWFYRYEVYAVALAGLLLLDAWRRLRGASTLRKAGAVLLFLLLSTMSFNYAVAAVRTPLAARNIYEQQYQMRRFALEFHSGPVAVNDLGLVSYGNDAYVLDLWGLGSEPVRQLRAAKSFDTAAMSRLTRDNGVGLAMIYDKWFREIPADWTRVATLRTVDNYTAAEDTVTFYIMPEADRAAVEQALSRFAATVPARVEFRLIPQGL